MMLTMQEIGLQDAKGRQLALDPRLSFIVQAPAGSGKTELLTQRVLKLLGHVNSPEEILAITFTKKAAAEMRARIIHALKKAATEPEPSVPHAKMTWQLAHTALARDKALQWNLLLNPNRLRIQTIDSFNASLIKYLPMLSHFGAPPEITQDATELYREAVQEFLSHLEENLAWSESIAALLLHMDNDLNKVQNLLINMLAKRDQWLPYIMMETDHEQLREHLEYHLASIVSDTLISITTQFPENLAEELLFLARFAAQQLEATNTPSPIRQCLNLITLPGHHFNEKNTWLALIELLLTKEDEWRKRIDVKLGFPAPSSTKNPAEKALYAETKERLSTLIASLSEQEKLRFALSELKKAPSSYYEENQWDTLKALYSVLRVVVAQLRVVFALHGKIDYIENALSALHALGNDETPTDLALYLDYQIRHLLIDEFQDTSNSQYRLIEKLIAGWEPHDGRTLFIVGDPMQSIYRFREAEVGLFIRARHSGIGQIPLVPITLSVNFRSTPQIVEWVNTRFQRVLPPYEDIATGAVSYSTCMANPQDDFAHSAVELHPCLNDDSLQGDAIVHLIQQSKTARPHDSIAILVRSRTHLEYVIPALKKAGIPYRAIDIDPLDSRPVIQDLMALTRAMLHPADRIAWLALLRAPWCGLSLNDLLILDDDNAQATIWEQLHQETRLSCMSPQGQQSLQRILPLLQHKMAERHRTALRLWIESTWILLGGPACLDQPSDLMDAASYFTLLEKHEVGSDLPQLDKLSAMVSQLFAAPNHQADNTLQIMTIHNAKGLEFDTVILPHLERKSPHDEKQLLLWMERPRENADNALILAPIHGSGQTSDKIYDFIKQQHQIKSAHESGRLLYVAATRAKKFLHVFFTVKGSTLAEAKPAAHSLLEKLWPAIHDDIRTLNSDFSTENEPLIASPRYLKRLIPGWVNPYQERHTQDTVKPMDLNRPVFLPEEFQARQLGILVHQLLQQISLQGVAFWQQGDKSSYLPMQLRRLGFAESELTHYAEIICLAIENTLSDPRGQWILMPHREAQSEFALTSFLNDKMTQLIIDRTFIDEDNIRWIIDYKTAACPGEDKEHFLNAEMLLYKDKMLSYASAFQHLDKRPIKLGLYFPLMTAWCEWSI